MPCLWLLEGLARAVIEEGQAPSALAQRYGLQLTRIRDSVAQVARDKILPSMLPSARARCAWG